MSASKPGTPQDESPHTAKSPLRNGQSPHDADTPTPDREADTRASGAPFAEPAWAQRTGLIVLVIGVLFLVVPIAASGLWDPFEFNVAELSRRIAVNAFGAGNLAL